MTPRPILVLYRIRNMTNPVSVVSGYIASIADRFQSTKLHTPTTFDRL